MATRKAAASKKEITVIARYKFKTNGKLNGTVCTLIRTGEGKEHKVWTHSNGCSASCDCEGFTTWHKKCFHLKSVEAIEAARKAAVTEPVATPAIAQSEVTAQPVIETAATEIVVKQPVPARKVSSIEANSPAWLMTGMGRNGTFAGRVA